MYQFLSKINSPQDLRALSIDELQTLCREIREYFVEVITDVGGHFAPSLGVVELSVALHYVFDTPHDKLVWDVGHQGYVHKILTGRREALPTIRQDGGISGFLRRSESEYDTFGAGHASTSISAALGFAAARDKLGENFKCVAIIGDGALTGGLAYEALNNAGALKKDLLVILNDNSMSISPNVGAIAHYLTEITTDPLYNKLKDEIWRLTGKLPVGKRHVRRFVRHAEESLKSLLVPGGLFEQLGFRYFGPLDGHSLPELIPVLRRLRDMRGPKLLHVRTVKGKGCDYAEKDSVKFHAVSGKSSDNGGVKLPSYNTVFTNAMIELAARDERIVAITAAMAEGTGLVAFQKAYPDRFYDTGIAEAHAVCFAAGLAAQGMRPVAAIYSTFLQRAYDQVIHDVSIQRLPVVFAMDRAGLCGSDGPTHHGAFDFSYLSCVPTMIVSAPKDGDELKNLLYTALSQDQAPFAIRYPKDTCVQLSANHIYTKLDIGSWEELQRGVDVALLAVGTMVPEAKKAAALLAEQGLKAGIFNCRFIKPFDVEMLKKIVSGYPNVIVVEEAALNGGLGSQVCHFLIENNIPVGRFATLGLPDRFVDHGSRQTLLNQLGLSPEKIAAKAISMMRSQVADSDTRWRTTPAEVVDHL